MKGFMKGKNLVTIVVFVVLLITMCSTAVFASDKENGGIAINAVKNHFVEKSQNDKQKELVDTMRQAAEADVPEAYPNIQEMEAVTIDHCKLYVKKIKKKQAKHEKRTAIQCKFKQKQIIKKNAEKRRLAEEKRLQRLEIKKYGGTREYAGTLRWTEYCSICNTPEYSTSSSSGRWEEGYSCASSDFPEGTILWIEGIGERRVDDTGCRSGVVDLLGSASNHDSENSGVAKIYILDKTKRV